MDILTVASLGGMEGGNWRAAWLQDFIRRSEAARAKTTSPVTGRPKPADSTSAVGVAQVAGMLVPAGGGSEILERKLKG